MVNNELVFDVLDKISAAIFNNVSYIADNAALQIVTFVTTLAIISSLLQLWRRRHIDYIITPVTPLVSILAWHYINNLYLLHNRLKLALDTTSYVVMQSKDYQNPFAAATGIKDVTARAVAETIYFASTEQRAVLLKTEPSELYLHFFNARDAIIGFPLFGRIDEIAERHGIFIAMMIVLAVLTVAYLFTSSKHFFIEMICAAACFRFAKNNLGVLLVIFTTVFVKAAIAQIIARLGPGDVQSAERTSR